MPLPLESPAGFKIHILLCPVMWNWGNLFSYYSSNYFTWSWSTSTWSPSSSSPSYSFPAVFPSLFSFSFFLVFFCSLGFYFVLAVGLNLQSNDLSHSSCFFFANPSSVSSSWASISHSLSVTTLTVFFLSIISSMSSIFFLQTLIATYVLNFRSSIKALFLDLSSSLIELSLTKESKILITDSALQILKCV